MASEPEASPSASMIREAEDAIENSSPTKSLERTLVKLAAALCLEMALLRVAVQSPQKQELHPKHR